jgi:steroid delta-isomerase-like uncharacterized protein
MIKEIGYCTSGGTIMDTNNSLMNKYFMTYEMGDIDLIKEFLHEKHIYYPPAGGDPENLEQRMNEEKLFFTAFSEIKVNINDQIFEGNKVATRITMTATHSGSFHGIPASGKRVTITYMDFAVIQQGKIIEEWAEFDIQAILNQLKP